MLPEVPLGNRNFLGTPSPFLTGDFFGFFCSLINDLSLYLTEIGRAQDIHYGLPNIDPFNLFVDDMSSFAQNRTGMESLMDDIQEFEEYKLHHVFHVSNRLVRIGSVDYNMYSYTDIHKNISSLHF